MMSYNESIKAVATDALKHVQGGMILGLGSGRAAATLVRGIGEKIARENISVRGVPTSLQIKLVAEEANIALVEPGEVSRIDAVFDGADQIDEGGHLIKGGGGALLRENILAGMAKTSIIMADQTKFVKELCAPVPIEIHPTARGFVSGLITEMGGAPEMRRLERGYPMFTENGNVILDCDFGAMQDPPGLAAELRQMPGVLEVGIFEKPDLIYKAKKDGLFEVLSPRLG